MTLTVVSVDSEIRGGWIKELTPPYFPKQVAGMTKLLLQSRKTKSAANPACSGLVLKVLSGLSQNEMIALNEGPVVIGGSSDCDLFLADPDISGACCVAEFIDGSVVIRTLRNPSVALFAGVGKARQPIRQEAKLEIEGVFVVGHVSLKLMKLGRQPRPIVEEKPSVQAPLSCTPPSVTPASPTGQMSLLQQKKDALDRFKQANHLRNLKRAQNKVTENKPFTEPEQRAKPARPWTSGKAFDGQSWGWIKPAGTLLSSLVISFWTLSAANGGAEKPQWVAQTAVTQVTPVSDEVIYVNQLPPTGAGDDSYALPEENESVEKLAEHLQAVFKQMLIARELPVDVKLIDEPDRWVVEGNLSEPKQKILQRMLVRFEVEQGLSKPIMTRLKSETESLPFEIVQVTSGRYGNIVTNTGDRLFVGDQFQGYQLVSIQDRHVVFTGKSRVTVEW